MFLAMNRTVCRLAVRGAARRLPAGALQGGRQLAPLSTSMRAQGSGPFPSLIISSNGVSASGSFAEAQATYLNPDKGIIKELDRVLADRRVGIVAHYYMDPELQGSLSALKWPHVFIADSLAMGEAAARMAATGGVDSIVCMGVDFMSESVRATLDANGYQHIPVYRLSERKIGCSLAESAERDAYAAWLHRAARVPKSLHVVYINTSLVTKAQAHELVPTITCTSSNVLQTVLQSYAQIPGLTIWYGPDTYMGENLHNLLTRLSQLPDDRVAAVHPAHTAASIRQILQTLVSQEGRFQFFQQGNCIVHHMFGSEVVQRVRADYPDAFHTAHLEVPGEMFELAMEAQERGQGVVGSTSNILNFILEKAKGAAKREGPRSKPERLKFVLGTEAGMVTSIVRGVQKILKDAPSAPQSAPLEVEIIFPVSSEAVSATGSDDDLAVVPGVQGGEGCSTAGGCATCPFMKMNSLDALVDLLERMPEAGSLTSGGVPRDLLGFLPPRREVQLVSGRSVGEVGALPIVHMRALMRGGRLSEQLVKDVLGRNVPEAQQPHAFVEQSAQQAAAVAGGQR